MPAKTHIFSHILAETRILAGSYLRTSILYFLMGYVFWIVGIEGIYGHPAPFYALILPAVQLKHVLWHVQAFVVLTMFLLITFTLIRRYRLLDEEPNANAQRRLVAWCILLAIVIPSSVAMIRGGTSSISQAYSRQAYEYIGDIGAGGSLHGLFSNFERYHEYLSMHAKVHPPGPIAILWILSFVVGRDPLALSFATIVFGALSVIPFYYWVRDMLGYRVAVQSTLLYVFVPTIVLFAATSADITFMPFTLTMLFFFWRSIQRGSLRYALAAGVVYALCSVISFSLVGIGAFFGLMGLWKLRVPSTRPAVFVTAIGMIVALLATHYLIWLWSGFNIFRVFELSKHQFDTDQLNLDRYDPRYPAWVFRLLNPMCWFYFAGIPVSMLAFRQMLDRTSPHRYLFVIIGIAVVAFDILYLARGEGERSAMYIMPFLVIPAGYCISEVTRRSESLQPLTLTLAFLAAQCWLTETLLYTYW